MHSDEFFPVSPSYPGRSEMLLRVFVDITGLLDDKGRRLHEAAFRSEQDKEAFKVCKFEGSRHGKLMNQSAFRDIFSCWNDILATQYLFRKLLLSSGKPNYPYLGEIWQVSLLPLFSPLYWRLSFSGSNYSVLPSTIAGLHKIALGVPSVIELMILLHKVDGESLQKNVILEPHIFAEQYDLLVNENWACAGPPNMMKTFDDALKGDVDMVFIKGVLPFHEYFNNTQYATFSFIMTCQYVCGRFFWLYDILLMECAFSTLAADGIYNPDYKSLNIKPFTTPEKRRRIILPILMENHSILESLSWRFIEILRETERLTGLSGHSYMVISYLDKLNTEFKLVDRNSAVSILALHERFKTALFDVVEYFRTQLCVIMKIKDKKDMIELAMDFSSPADELRCILNSQNGGGFD